MLVFARSPLVRWRVTDEIQAIFAVKVAFVLPTVAKLHRSGESSPWKSLIKSAEAER
jgi:hypothetical protein